MKRKNLVKQGEQQPVEDQVLKIKREDIQLVQKKQNLETIALDSMIN